MAESDNVWVYDCVSKGVFGSECKKFGEYGNLVDAALDIESKIKQIKGDVVVFMSPVTGRAYSIKTHYLIVTIGLINAFLSSQEVPEPPA